MIHRPRSLGGLAATCAVLAIAVAACSGSASPSPSAAASTSVATAASLAPSVAPSVAASEAPSLDLSSFAIPSFNADTNLEALLPNEFCGTKTKKFSFAGATFLAQPSANNQAFLAILSQMGKGPGDVSVAVAGVQTPACVGISFVAFRIKGADQGQFEQLFLAAQAKDSGVQPTKGNVGGKDVWTYTDKTGAVHQWLYFKGDVAFGVTASTEAQAAQALPLLP